MFINIAKTIEKKDKYLAELVESIDNIIDKDSYSVIAKGRTIAEIITKKIAEEEQLDELLYCNQNDRISSLSNEGIIEKYLVDSFHIIRTTGNKVIHDKVDGIIENSLKVSRNLNIILNWYVPLYIDHSFIEVEYVEPKLIQSSQNNNPFDISNEKILDKLVERILLRLDIKDLINKKLVNFNKQISQEAAELAIEKEGIDTIKTNYEDIKQKFYLQVREGGSPYIVFTRERLRQVLDKENWVFSTGDGAITIYNKDFRQVFDDLGIKLPSRMNLQFWMKRPLKGVASLQVEIAGAGLEFKPLRLALSNSLKAKFETDSEIILSKPNAGLAMTLKIPANDIIENADDTLENVEKNTDNIEAGVVKLVGYFADEIVNKWIYEDAIGIIRDYFKS
jgi:hypothetical protein